MLKSKRLLAAMLCSFCASTVLAETAFVIEEPTGGSTRSGIGLLSGWAVSDSGIESIEAYLDGAELGPVPFGSARWDVAEAYPGEPNALYSGFAVQFDYWAAGAGDHTVRLVLTEQDGDIIERTVDFEVLELHPRFVPLPEDIRTDGVLVDSPEDGRLVIHGIQIEDEEVSVELQWDPAAQQFLVAAVNHDSAPQANRPPVANARGDREARAGSVVLLKGEGSDSDGYITSHAWSQVSGPTVNLVDSGQWSVRFNAPHGPGKIRLRLQVTDDDGLTGFDDVIIRVTGHVVANIRPEAKAGPDFTVLAGEAVSITGNGSDSDGTIASWNWSRVGGKSVSLHNARSRTVEFTAPEDDGYVRLRLHVTDDDGATDYDDVVVRFELPEPENLAPTANAGANRTVETGDEVVIRGNGEDSDGEITGWSWTQVSGPNVSLSGASTREVSFHAPDSAATIRLRLQVTDNEGATDTDDVTVTVVEPAAPDNTTGSTVESMLSVINDARGTARDCNDGNGEYPAQPELIWSSSLAEIAMIHSMDMARQGYFAHDSLDQVWSDRVWPYWNGTRLGENIAASSHDRTNEQVVQLWLNSPPHCAAIMDSRFTHAGVGSGHDADNGFDYHYFWTLDFGG